MSISSEKNRGWTYDPSELLGILARSISNSGSGSSQSSTSNHGKASPLERNEEESEASSSLNYEICSEKIQFLEGKNCQLTLDYLQTLFEETVEKCRKSWEKDPSLAENEQEMVESCREYYMDSMIREWNWLMEIWIKKPKINLEEILLIHENLMELSEKICSRAKKNDDSGLNVLYKNRNFVKNSSEQGKEQSDCWKSEIGRVQKHIAIHHQKFGNIFVPKICKVRIPCGQNEYFSDLEIGLDSEGQPMAVKHIKSTFPIAAVASAVAALSHLEHRHLLPSYLSPGPNCVLATPLMNSNLGQLVMFLKSTSQLTSKAFPIVHQLIDGLFFLQTRKPAIVHGNLKPTNVFVDANGVLKIAEFGLNLEISKAAVSSLIWRSPEQLSSKRRGQQHSSLPTDIASAGMLMHFVLSGGRHPCGETVGEILSNLAEGRTELTVTDASARQLLNRMIAHVEERSDIFEVIRHIYWWPTEEKWGLVAALKTTIGPQVEASNDLYGFLVQATEELVVGEDQAIVFCRGGVKDTKQDLSEFLYLVRNFPVPLGHYIQQRLPNLPLHLYKILSPTPWAKSTNLKHFFETNHFPA